MKFKNFKNLDVRKKVFVCINRLKIICTASYGGLWKLLSLRRAGHVGPMEVTRTSLISPVKINLLKNDRMVEDIKVRLCSMDGRQRKLAALGVRRHVCLLAVLKLKVHFQKS
jgi:hypothetical protein